VILVVLAGCGGEQSPRATPGVTATVAPPQAAVEGSLPGALTDRTCPAAGDDWPTMTIALDARTAWIACKEDDAVESLAGAKVELDGQAIAVLSAFGAIWALSDRGTLFRIENGKVGQKIDLEAGRPYNLWAGAGSMWAIDDGTGQVIRVDPATNQVVAKVQVGDGPADMAFAGRSAWVINHRDRTLVVIDTRTNRARTLATIAEQNAAPERMALLRGSLWITGRGMDLWQVDPATGRVSRTVEIGGSGIDVVAAGGALWVPARSDESDESGLPRRCGA
jgi:YVTN family beta-propeller protein